MALLLPLPPRGRVMLLAVLAAALIVLAPPRPARAAAGMEIAIQDDNVLVDDAYYGRDRALDQIRDLGAGRVRVNLSWNVVLGSQARRRYMPHHVVYDWAKYDALVDAARARGLHVQMTITGPAPRWATADHRAGVYRPDSARFGAYARSAALHFFSRVDRYSIWNEPNYKGWLQPVRQAPKLYRGLFRAAWRGVKSVDPGVPVLIGETAPYAGKGRGMAPLRFLRQMTCTDSHWRRHCMGIFADGYAHHPYDLRHAPEYRYPGRDNVTIGTLPRLDFALARLASTGALRTRQGAPLPVFLTEFGYMGSGKYRLPAGRRAAYLRRAFQIARRDPQVHSMLQYLLVKPPPPWDFFDTSLVSRGGSPSAAYNALHDFARR